MQLQLIENTLFIDNSRMEHFVSCDRRGEYAIVRRRVPSGFNAALFCGEVCHLALQFRYLYYPVNVPIPPECVWKMRHIAQLAYELNPDYPNRKPDEYRTMEYVQNVLTLYCKAYPTEDFKILLYNNRPLVERSFAVLLGEIDGVKIMWIGRIDLGIELPTGGIYVNDHKTSQMGGSYFAIGFVTSSQMMGYTLSLNQVIKKPIRGVQVNTLITRAITRTGKGVEFERHRIPYSYESLEGWRENIMQLAGDFLHCNKRQFWPMRTTQCITRYGACPYLSVCSLDPAQRDGELYSGSFQDDDFTPMHKDLINLEQIYNMSLPLHWEDELSVKPETKKGVDPTALINDIINQVKI